MTVRPALRTSVLLVAGVLAAAIGGPWLVGELRALPDGRTLAARSGERVVTLDVGGMTCAGCAAKVESEVSAVPGVSRVAVRLGPRRAYVVCRPDVADSALVGAIHRAGPGFLAAIARP